ncbi:MAG TPA: hypothetical protein VK137_10165 [Planctomycetaceae bacterium]|nr:hypothetical protein [Planctomycetaceae bacterium]
MADLKDARLIYFKGFLFLLGGGLAAFLLLIEHPSFRTALLLGLAIWCSARFYYFAFYVIEHYVDGEYRFAGLWSFVRYVLSRHHRKGSVVSEQPPDEDSLPR